MIPNRMDALLPKRQEFAAASQAVSEQMGELGRVTPEAIERAMNSAIELIEGLEVASATPKHVHTGNTFNDRSQHAYRAEGDFVQTKYEGPKQVVHHTTQVDVPSDKMYRLGEDLILSTSGRFVFRPISRKLFTAFGELDLSESETAKLLAYIKYDFSIS